MYDKWQRSYLLKDRHPEQIKKCIAYMTEWLKKFSLRNASPKRLPDAEALAKSWNQASAFRGKTVQDLALAVDAVDAWKKSSILKSKTPSQIEAAIAKVKHCKTAVAAQKEKKQQEFTILQEWKKSPTLSKITPRSLEESLTLVEEKKRNFLLNPNTPQHIEAALLMVEHWQKNSHLKKVNSQMLCDAEVIFEEWKKVFSNSKASDLTDAAQIVAGWQENSALKRKTLNQLQKDWELAAEWHGIREFQGKSPEHIFETVKVVEECAKALTGSEYQKLVKAEEQVVDVAAVALIDPDLPASVDINLVDPNSSQWEENYHLRRGLNKLVPPNQILGEAFSVGAHIVEENQQFIINETVPLTAFVLAEMIRKHPKYRKGQRVALYICYAGSGEPSFAQILATELYTIVYAANGYVPINYQTGEVKLRTGVEWVPFYPEGTTMREKRRAIYKQFIKKLPGVR